MKGAFLVGFDPIAFVQLGIVVALPFEKFLLGAIIHVDVDIAILYAFVDDSIILCGQGETQFVNAYLHTSVIARVLHEVIGIDWHGLSQSQKDEE